MDELFAQPEILSVSQFIGTVESKDLRMVQGIQKLYLFLDLCKNNEYSQAEIVANDSKSSAIYTYLAEKYLQQADVLKAQNAFIKSGDYRGVQLTKKLEKITVIHYSLSRKDPVKKRAEIAAYLGDYDEAERLYLSIDRKDLAMDFWIRLGDWIKVVKLIKSGSGADDHLLESALNNVGDYFYDRQDW